jgi:hypothetical protein
MRNFTLISFLLLALNSSGQIKHSISNSGANKEFLLSTNSGCIYTPIGLKMGFIGNPGVYLGLRYGQGKDFDGVHPVPSDLYSIVGGINKAILVKNNFRLIGQLGIGLAQWGDFTWQEASYNGYEIECGFLIQKKRILVTLTGNLINAFKSNQSGDVCLGIGYAFSSRTKKEK